MYPGGCSVLLVGYSKYPAGFSKHRTFWPSSFTFISGESESGVLFCKL